MAQKTASKVLVEKPTTEKLKALKVFSWPIWAKEVSSFDWYYDEQEICYFLEGEVIVKIPDGEVAFGKGIRDISPGVEMRLEYPEGREKTLPIWMSGAL